jgi:hypothetical protein
MLRRHGHFQQESLNTLTAKIKEEFVAMLPPTIFFFVALHIVALIRVLMLKGTGVAPMTSVTVAVAALILGKAVLIADMLPFINRYPHKPFGLQRRVEDPDLPRGGGAHPLSGAPRRFLATGGRSRRR